MRKIDYQKIIDNIDHMVNTLEYDSTRSPGKVKLNADTLVNLLALKEKYEGLVAASPKTVEAPAVKKEEAVVEAPVKKTTRTKAATKAAK